MRLVERFPKQNTTWELPIDLRQTAVGPTIGMQMNLSQICSFRAQDIGMIGYQMARLLPDIS